MISRLRLCDPTEPLWRILLYRAGRKLSALCVRGFYRLRVVGAENIPPSGGLLLISNHQSHADPSLLGVALGRRNMASLARVGLFGNRLFGALLRALGAIAIRQNESDTAAIRAVIAELRKGRIVLVFPEGSRSPDGAVHPFKRGTWLLLNKSGCDVLPAAVEGAFDAWPRDRLLPRLVGQRCMVAFGKPIPHAELGRMGADAALAHLAGVVDQMRLDLRGRLRESSRGRLPRPGPGDAPSAATANSAARAGA